MPTEIQRYYPRLSTIVTTEEIPDVLGFVKDGVVWVLDQVHYKDLQYSKSPQGDAAFYSLSIVSKKRLAIEIPGTGIALVINKDWEDNNISAFPITLEYEWKVLAFLRGFNVSNFSFSPQEIYELALRVLNITEEQAMAHFINTFTVPIDENTTPLAQYVADIEQEEGITLPTVTEETTLKDIAREIYEQTEKYSTLVGFGTYLFNNGIDETLINVKIFFRALLPEDIDAYIKDILIPKFRATLLLTAGVEFPRTMLQPVYDEHGNDLYSPTTGTEENPVQPPSGNPLTVIPPDDEGFPKVMLSFGEALFYADTKNGFGYNMDLVINTSSPAMIGNSGLIIDINNLKIDLSDKENILEADLDGRPPEFMGVYIERSDIYLPQKWFKKETGQTLAITGDHLIIGTGGVSGTIALRATYGTTIDEETGVEYVNRYYDEYFNFVYANTITVIHPDGNEYSIPDYQSLLDYINNLDSPNQLKFKYPLSITGVNDNITRVFETEQQYNTYLSNLQALDENRFIWFKLGRNPEKALRLGFDRFEITFHHGEVDYSYLHAQLVIPKFKRNDGNNTEDGKATIDLVGQWFSSEEFSLNASFIPSGLPLTLFNFITFTIEEVGLGKVDDIFYIEGDTRISFPEGSLMYHLTDDLRIDLPKIRFYGDGHIEIPGGNASIPINRSLPLGPIDLNVTTIHFGSNQKRLDSEGMERSYNYLGFDGGISVDPLGLDLRGDGVKYYYTVDNDEILQQKIDSGEVSQEDVDNGTVTADQFGDSYLHISTIAIEIIIPGDATKDDAIAIINGMLSIPEPGVSEEYSGRVGVKFPKLKLGGIDAQLSLIPKYSAFLLEVAYSPPLPNPIAATGLAFYEYGGLLGYRYLAEKEAIGMDSENTWYEYFKYPQIGVNKAKFNKPPNTLDSNPSLSIGAGTVIATLGSSDIFSTRLMAILSLPSSFHFDGRANVLGERLGMLSYTDPPFFAGFSIGDHSVEAWFGADYALPKNNGNIIDLYAEVEAYFSTNNSKAWYIHFGTSDNPVNAELLFHIFRMQAYLTISAKGIEGAARIDFELKKNFFGIKVHINAYIELGGYISFEKPQIGGYITAGGMIAISFWKIVGFEVKLDTILSVEAPNPFLIYAELRLRICIRIIFRICVRVKVKLKWGGNGDLDRTPIAPTLPYSSFENVMAESSSRILNQPEFETLASSNQGNGHPFSAKGIHMLTYEEFDLDLLVTSQPTVGNLEQIKSVIPIDTYIDIKIGKGLVASTETSGKIGGYNNPPEDHTDKIPPKNIMKGKELRQETHKYSIEDIKIMASSGDTWKEYHPYEAIVKPPDRPSVRHLKIGYWQKQEKRYDSIRILANNPFSYTESGEPGWVIPEQMGITPSDLFCEAEEKSMDCSNVLNIPKDTVYYPPTQYDGHFINGAYYTLDGYFADTIMLDSNGNVTNIIPPNQYFRVASPPNNFGFPYSLVFDNTHRLVIILPEHSQKVALKLTTSAQSVKIKLYKSERNSESDTTDYVEIETLEKTQTELSEEIIYENSTQFISKIIIEPYLINIDEINDLQNQIAELELQLDLSGEQTLPKEDAELYDDLIKQLEHLLNSSCGERAKVCFTSLQEVCWLSKDNWEFNLTIPSQEAIAADQQAMKDAIEKMVQPTWRPNTYYCIQLTLKDEVDDGNSMGRRFNYYYAFKTVGPIGHYHKHSEVDYVADNDNENNDHLPLTSIRSYIDYRRSYPNADGNLLKAKPLFYGNEQCQLNLFFIKPYVSNLFKDWFEYSEAGLGELNGTMYFTIKDPINGDFIPYPLPQGYDEEFVPGAQESWASDNDPLLPASIQLLNNFIENINENSDTINCEIHLGDKLIPASLYSTVKLTNLKPEKLYTALVYNAFEQKSEKIHEYVFQTSRYKNFTEQIESYILVEKDYLNNIISKKYACYEIILSLNQSQINNALILTSDDVDSNPQLDAITTQYLHPFDRLIEGVFEINPVDPPNFTDFIRIIDKATLKVVGIWIRNPEPFNDPKIPKEDIINSLEVLDVEENELSYHKLFSKDYSQIFIMKKESEFITDEKLMFRFKYLQWDGQTSTYVVDTDSEFSIVTTKVIEINPQN